MEIVECEKRNNCCTFEFVEQSTGTGEKGSYRRAQYTNLKFGSDPHIYSTVAMYVYLAGRIILFQPLPLSRSDV